MGLINYQSQVRKRQVHESFRPFHYDLWHPGADIKDIKDVRVYELPLFLNSAVYCFHLVYKVGETKPPVVH